MAIDSALLFEALRAKQERDQTLRDEVLRSTLSSEEAANYLGVSRGLLQRWRERHAGPCFVLVGRWHRYYQSELDDWARSVGRSAGDVVTQAEIEELAGSVIPHAILDRVELDEEPHQEPKGVEP